MQKLFRLFVLAATMAALDSAASGVAAQTANNVVCDGCVHARDLANGAVIGGKIRDGSVVTGKIADQAVSTPKIRNGAVTTGKIRAKSVTPSRLSQPTGGAVTPVPQDWIDLPTDTIVNSLTVRVPGPGIVIVNASAYAEFLSDNAIVLCNVTTLSTIGAPTTRATGSNADVDDAYASIALTRGFPVTVAGDVTYNFVCKPNAGSNASIFNALMTAIYTPTDIRVP